MAVHAGARSLAALEEHAASSKDEEEIMWRGRRSDYEESFFFLKTNSFST